MRIGPDYSISAMDHQLLNKTASDKTYGLATVFTILDQLLVSQDPTCSSCVLLMQSPYKHSDRMHCVGRLLRDEANLCLVELALAGLPISPACPKSSSCVLHD